MYTKAMRKINKLRIITYMMLFGLLLAGTGCGKQDTLGEGTYFHHSIADQTQRVEDTQNVQEENSQELYLIVDVDQIEETLRLYRYANGMEYRYYYGTGTRFYDEYGNRTTVASFQQGYLISIGNVNVEGILCDATISDKAWVYDNVRRFNVSADLNMLQIGDSKYRYDDSTYVFSGDERVDMQSLAKGDTLTVVGVDKDILSVRITTSQGTLELENTDLFDGSFLQLGNKIFTEITPNFSMQVPEGTYELTVANNGWGGSCEVTITRGQTTTIDLDKIKGKGPKSGKIRFLIDVSGSVLMIDDKQVDYSKPVKLTYGQHDIAVYADGYDVWRRNLYVNSKESTIMINLKDEEDTKTETTGGSSGGETNTDASTNSSTESKSAQSGTSGTQSSESSKRQEELDLIKDLLSNMTNASSIVSN